MYLIIGILAFTLVTMVVLCITMQNRRMARHEAYMRDLYKRTGAKRIE